MDMLPDPLGSYDACRSCRVPLDLHEGFCSACAARKVDVAVYRFGVYFEFSFVLFPDRALPFVKGAWVENETVANLRYPCIDLPALEEEALRLWRTDEQFRSDVLRSAEAVAFTRFGKRSIRCAV